MRNGRAGVGKNPRGSRGAKARNVDWDPIRGSHQGQRPVAASTGRTHDLHPTSKPNARFSLQRGRRPHMTPKCRPRDFRVSARPNLPKKCLCRLKPNPRGRNLAGIRGEFDRLAKKKRRKSCYIKDLWWLCWQSGANLSLPAICWKCRVILPNCRGQHRLIPAESPRTSMGWLGLSLFQGAGRSSFHSREGRFRNTALRAFT
jgi:hypothetical protein